MSCYVSQINLTIKTKYQQITRKERKFANLPIFFGTLTVCVLYSSGFLSFIHFFEISKWKFSL